MLGRWMIFWDGLFSGSMLNFQGVIYHLSDHYGKNGFDLDGNQGLISSSLGFVFSVIFLCRSAPWWITIWKKNSIWDPRSCLCCLGIPTESIHIWSYMTYLYVYLHIIYIWENIIRYKVSEVFLLLSLCFKCCFCLPNVWSCIVQQIISLWQLGPGGGFHCLLNVRTYMWKIISWFWSGFWVRKHLLTGYWEQ